MLQDFTRSPPYFSQILKPDLDDKNFSRDYLGVLCGGFVSLLSFSSFLIKRQYPLAKAFNLEGT